MSDGDDTQDVTNGRRLPSALMIILWLSVGGNIAQLASSPIGQMVCAEAVKPCKVELESTVEDLDDCQDDLEDCEDDLENCESE